MRIPWAPQQLTNTPNRKQTKLFTTAKLFPETFIIDTDCDKLAAHKLYDASDSDPD